MTQDTTVSITGTCPNCSRNGYLRATVSTTLETGSSTAVVVCSRCGAGSNRASTYVIALREWARRVAAEAADAAARARARKPAKAPGTLSDKNLKIRMTRISRYARIILPALITRETGDLKSEKVQNNLCIRSFNIARKMAAKRADVYKQVKAGELV
jgi:NMD protein affecting ribosome stability and mRNA decay